MGSRQNEWKAGKGRLGLGLSRSPSKARQGSIRPPVGEGPPPHSGAGREGFASRLAFPQRDCDSPDTFIIMGAQAPATVTRVPHPGFSSYVSSGVSEGAPSCPGGGFGARLWSRGKGHMCGQACSLGKAADASVFPEGRFLDQRCGPPGQVSQWVRGIGGPSHVGWGGRRESRRL